jgi:hypothetical protein
MKKRSIGFITVGLSDLDELKINTDIERNRALMQIEDNYSMGSRRYEEIENIDWKKTDKINTINQYRKKIKMLEECLSNMEEKYAKIEGDSAVICKDYLSKLNIHMSLNKQVSTLKVDKKQ